VSHERQDSGAECVGVLEGGSGGPAATHKHAHSRAPCTTTHLCADGVHHWVEGLIQVLRDLIVTQQHVANHLAARNELPEGGPLAHGRER
jgi:hypothetical protein